MLKWLDASASVRFGQELARELLSTLSTTAATVRDAKFAAKAEKALIKADVKVREFRRANPMNFYKRSRLANTFLWTLKDGGCPPDYAQELTEWLTFRL
jgi:hypothetical protein